MDDFLTERQHKILLLVVRDYIESAQPIGSQRLLEHYALETSSATVRNEMAALTEMGYLRQPHTSAGRVPTEEAYRYFVSQMLKQSELPAPVQHTISHQFHQARPEVEQWMTLAAAVLAQQAQAVSLVTAPHPHQPRFKHLELISTQGRQVLLVLVLTGGEVCQQILTLAEPVTQERLSLAALVLNQTFGGLMVEEMETQPLPGEALEHDISLLAREELRRVAGRAGGALYYDGLTNFLAEPEFSDSEEARRTLRLLEERAPLQRFLQQTASTQEVGGVQVLIGASVVWEELSQCSMVLARYGVPGQLTGVLGVMGPLRMPYNRSIPAVRYVANLLSDLVGTTLANEDFSNKGEQE